MTDGLQASPGVERLRHRYPSLDVAYKVLSIPQAAFGAVVITLTIAAAVLASATESLNTLATDTHNS